MKASELLFDPRPGDDVRVKKNASSIYGGAPAVVESRAMTGKGWNLKLRFDSGAWGWFLGSELERDV